MFLFRVIRRAGFLISIAILIFAATKAFAADAPMSPAQIALYQGPDREKIILEGARKKKASWFSITRTHGLSLSRRSLRRSIRSSKFQNGAPRAPTSLKEYWKKAARDATWPMLLRARKPTSQVSTRRNSSRNITLPRSAFTMVKYWPKANAVSITGPTASFILASVSTRISFLPLRPPRASKISLTASGKARWLFLAPQCLPAGSARF